MSRPTTTARLLNRAFALLVVLVLLAGAAGVTTSVLQNNSVRQLSEQIVPLRLAGSHMRAVLYDAQRSLRGYLLTGQVGFLDQFTSASAAFGPAAQRLRSLAIRPGDRTAIEEQVRLAGDWWRHADRQSGLAPRSPQAAAAATSGARLFEAFLTANNRLDADLALRGNRVRESSQVLHSMTLGALVGLTLLAVLIAAATAVRTTARVTRPLHRLVAVLEGLGEGDHAARAPVDVDVDEIGAVARATNAMADEADRTRSLAAERTRLAVLAQEIGIRIRAHLSVGATLDEAAAGLGETLAADEVLVRLSSKVRGGHRTARWSRASGGAAQPGTDALAALGPDWLLDRGGDRACLVLGPDADDHAVPAEELAALRAAGATAALALPFSGGSGPAGVVTVIRRGGAAWSDPEVSAGESVVADLGRGLLQAHLYEREQELVARLRDLDNAKTDFMSTVSHELRTPLTSIAGYLEMLTDGDAGELTDGQRRMLGVLERNTARLSSLVADLLVLSRIESGGLRSERREVEYGWLVTSAVAAVGPAATAADVTVETEVGGVLTGEADPEHIDRVLTNLLGNAVKFTPSGGTVRVTAYREGDWVVIRVSDTGIGIPEAEQAQLFDRFFRASNATERAIPGTGLGLAIVRTIVMQHGGSIGVESRTGEGTTFTVRLPA